MPECSIIPLIRFAIPDKSGFDFENLYHFVHKLPVSQTFFQYSIIPIFHSSNIPFFHSFNILPRVAFFFPAQKHLKIFAVQEVSGIA